jgi:hypothetical protein
MFRADRNVNSAQGPALDGVTVYVCTQPVTSAAGVVPPAPLATIYYDEAGTMPIDQVNAPLQTDGLGNAFFYALTGLYSIIYYDSLQRIPYTLFTDQQVVSQGGGSVTSVALKGDGVLFTTAITGSPIISAGTLDLSLSPVNYNANTFPAGPAFGGPAPLAPRKLVAADLPSGGGSVTSVALSLNGSALLSLSVSGSPITSAGTLAGTINFVNQPANTIVAGPASGAPGPLSARPGVAADICGIVPTSFSATPAFNAAAFAQPTFTMTLTGNVTSSTISNPIAGQTITFVITQNATGGWTFTWPTNTRGSSNVEPTANAVSVQSFVFDGSVWRATGPGSVNAS